ncbi:hypothetical protein ACFE04_012270 [Oxalis oulophora]
MDESLVEKSWDKSNEDKDLTLIDPAICLLFEFSLIVERTMLIDFRARRNGFKAYWIALSSTSPAPLAGFADISTRNRRVYLIKMDPIHLFFFSVRKERKERYKSYIRKNFWLFWDKEAHGIETGGIEDRKRVKSKYLVNREKKDSLITTGGPGIPWTSLEFPCRELQFYAGSSYQKDLATFPSSKLEQDLS